MIGNFLVDDNPKRMIDFIHVFLLLPQNNGYKYQTIPCFLSFNSAISIKASNLPLLNKPTRSHTFCT